MSKTLISTQAQYEAAVWFAEAWSGPSGRCTKVFLPWSINAAVEWEATP